MNLSIVNTNNSKSVVLPPKVGQINNWYYVPHIQDETGVTTLYDMSMTDNTLIKSGGDDPEYKLGDGDNNGYRVVSLNEQDRYGIDYGFTDTSVDFDAIYVQGSNPTYAIAGCVTELSEAVSNSFIFELYGSSINYIRFEKINPGLRVSVRGTGGLTHHATASYFAADTTNTFVLTLRTAPNNDITVHLRVGGSNVPWDVGSGTITGGQGSNSFSSMKVMDDFIGEFAEIIVYGEGLDDDEMLQAEEYLQDKWNCD